MLQPETKPKVYFQGQKVKLSGTKLETVGTPPEINAAAAKWTIILSQRVLQKVPRYVAISLLIAIANTILVDMH